MPASPASTVRSARPAPIHPPAAPRARSTFHSLEFEPPIVRSSDPFCLVSASGDAASGGWVDDISSQLIVNFNCIDSGTALVTVTVPLQVHERVVNASFAFRKECRWTSTPGFDVTLGAWIKNEGGTYAVRNGAATPAFSLWDPKAIVRARSYSSTFYLQMSTPDEQEFEWPTAESSDPMVKVTLGGPASKGGKAKPPAADKPPMALVVKYDCMKTGSSTITVTIPLGPWNEAAFSFVKVVPLLCAPLLATRAPLAAACANPLAARATSARAACCSYPSDLVS